MNYDDCTRPSTPLQGRKMQQLKVIKRDQVEVVTVCPLRVRRLITYESILQGHSMSCKLILVSTVHLITTRVL